jgi:hypothetical protein
MFHLLAQHSPPTAYKLLFRLDAQDTKSPLVVLQLGWRKRQGLQLANEVDQEPALCEVLMPNAL